MTRRHISTTERVRIFERHAGVCHMCGVKITERDAWDVSHETPLALGGADDASNWKPAHRKCHREHTSKEDIPRIAKAKAQRAAHIGAKVSRNPMPGSRRTKWRRRMDGTVERREG